MNVNRRADLHRVVKFLRLFRRKSNAAVGCGITGKDTSVHAGSAIEAQKPLHRRLLEAAPLRNGCRAIGARLHHMSSPIDDLPIKRRMMIRIFLDHLEIPGRGRMAFPAAGDRRRDLHFSVLVKRRPLVCQIQIDLQISFTLGTHNTRQQHRNTQTYKDRSHDRPRNERWNLREVNSPARSGNGIHSTSSIPHKVATSWAEIRVERAPRCNRRLCSFERSGPDAPPGKMTRFSPRQLYPKIPCNFNQRTSWPDGFCDIPMPPSFQEPAQLNSYSQIEF